MFHVVNPLLPAAWFHSSSSVKPNDAQSSRSYTQHVNAVKVIYRMRGGAQSRLVLGDDDNLWVVKFKNNPQHVRVLANELIATQIAATIGLSVPNVGIVDVSQSLIMSSPPQFIDKGALGRELCASGLQFGSRFAVGMISSHLDVYLADEQLFHARNLKEFAGVLAFDKWTGNCDYRQVVYRRNEAERGHHAVFIDQGGCFNAGEWDFQDAPLRGVFAQKCAYTPVNGWESFEPWLSRIEQFDPEALWDIVRGVPLEWYGGKVSELEALTEKLITRRCRVRELISQFRDSDKHPFSNWKPENSVMCSADSYRIEDRMLPPMPEGSES